MVCGGGVVANKYLRERLKEEKTRGFSLYISPFGYCSDNAAIVAGLGFYLYNKKGRKSSINLKAEAN